MVRWDSMAGAPLEASPPTRGQIFLSTGAVMTASPASVRLDCPSTGDSIECQGVLAADLLEATQGAVPSNRLRGVFGARLDSLLQLVAGERVELSPANALELGGFDTLFVELTGQCNERCAHCYAESGPEVITALERPVVEAVIRDAVGLGFRRIQFTGGDPLLCRFLPELVAYVRELKGPAVEIYTNGLALVPSLLNQLAPLTPSFAFSFYSADPTVHDAITGVSGSQQRTLAAIDRCLSAGLEVRAAVIAMPSNQASLAETIELLTVNGVRRVSWSGTSEVGRGEYFERPGELGDSDAGHRALPSGPSSDTEPVASPQFVESLVRGTLCVSSNGDVLPCIFNRRTILGNVRERGLMGIARGPRVRHQLAMAAERSLACSGCRLTDFAIRQSAGGA